MRRVFSLLAASAAVATNPITRVAELLQNLSNQIEAEGKAEQKLFKKYVCWFKQTTKEKTASNAEAEARIEQLTTFIDDVKNGRIEFTTDRQDREKELAAINKQLETMKNNRAAEKADFEAAEDELDKGLTALTSAVDFLAEGTKGSFLAKKFDIRKVLSLSNLGISKSDVRFLEAALDRDAQPENKDWEKLNKEATFKKKYTKRSGEIQDILADMKESFQKNLDDARTKESDAIAAYENLKGAKTDEKEAAEQALLDLEGENGARAMNLADAEDEKGRLEQQVTNDTTFLSEVADSHETKLGEWKERTRLRTEEVASIANAIGILRSDDSRDLFKKSFNSQGYLFAQEDAKNNGDRKSRAIALVYRSLKGKKVRSFAKMMAGAVEGVGEVITAIDEMLGELTEEDKNDQEWKEECESFSHEKKKNALKHARAADDEQATIERKEALIEELNEKIEDAEDKIKALKEALADATRNREDENAQFKASDADDKAAVVLVEKAMGALEQFYTDNADSLGFVQTGDEPMVAAGEAPAPPPSTWDSGYGGKKEENNGVVGILSLIKEDIEKDLKEAQTAEDEAEAEFQEFKTNTELDIAAQESAITDFKSSRASAEDAKSTAESQKLSALKLNEAEIKEYKAKEPDCYFIAVSFPTRKENRAKEVDGLHKAKRILQGSD